MDKLLAKKINLLVHLAQVDGKFHDSEQKLLHTILKEKGFEGKAPLESQADMSVAEQIKEVPEKTELLYWAIRMMKADDVIHPEELAYCKTLAAKLKFTAEVVDHFASHDNTLTLAEFEKASARFIINTNA